MLQAGSGPGSRASLGFIVFQGLELILGLVGSLEFMVSRGLEVTLGLMASLEFMAF